METDQKMERHKHPLGIWLERELAKIHPNGDNGEPHPGLTCQVFFAIGQVAMGVIHATDIPGVWRFVSEGREQSGAIRTIDRYFTIDLIAMIDIPREPAIIQRLPNAGRIVMPQG